MTNEPTTNQDEQKSNSGAAATMETEPFAEIKTVKNEARAAAELIPVTAEGIAPQDFAHVVDQAKMMALAREWIPAHMQGHIGPCVAAFSMALRWKMDPYAVARASYVVKGIIGFMSSMWNSVLYNSGVLEGNLKYEYKGEGDGRYVIVRGKLKREKDVLEYTSPPVSMLKPKRNERGELKGSPLWETNPDQQLGYHGSVFWQRRHCPEVMMSLYSKEELEESNIGPEHARDVTPRNRSVEGEELRMRLEAARASQAAEQGDEAAEGYHPNVVEKALRDSLLATPIGEFAAWSPAATKALQRHPIVTVGDLIKLTSFTAPPHVAAEINMRLSEKGLKRERASTRRPRPRTKR
jgi:hypothetical protein